MSSAATISSSIGIHGHPFENEKKYFISNEIKETYLYCYNALSDIRTLSIDTAEKNRLLSLIANVYTRSFEYMEKAIENRKTYSFTYKEEFSSFESYRSQIEKATDRGALRTYLTLALTELRMDVGAFDKLTRAKNEELLRLIEIKKEFCPNLNREIEALGGFDLPSLFSTTSETEKKFIDFLDCLKTASEGEMSPVYTPTAEASPTIDHAPTREIEAAPKKTIPDTSQVTEPEIYRNNLKNLEFGQEAPQIFDSERVTIAEGQGTSENQKGGVRPTQPKTDSSGCFGIAINDLNIRPAQKSLMSEANNLPTVRVSIDYHTGWGKAIGVCCESNGWKEPICFTYEWNKWSGEVPTGKDWKFVILQEGKVAQWEKREEGNRNIQAGDALDLTGKVRF